MTYSEDEIKEQLGIESWRNLSKDKMLRFAAMMPDMSTEAALKIIEQFPEFSKFALEVVGSMETAHAATLAANQGSQEKVYAALEDIRDILRGELQNEDLTWEQRVYIIEQIQETGRLAFEKDSENKRLLDGLLRKVAVVGVAAVALGVVFVGGKVMIEQGDDAPEA